MAISQAALANIINHNASTLCSKQGAKMVNEIASGRNNGFDDVDPSEYHDQWDDFSLSDTSQNIEEGVAMPSMKYNENSVSNSRMPDVIKQSMLSKRINTNTEMENLTEMARAQGAKKQRVNEAKGRVLEQAPAPAVGIDYTILKGLIKECLAEYFKSNPINESKGSGSQSMAYSQNTHKVRIIEDNGDIYGGKLTFQGNVNDKKK